MVRLCRVRADHNEDTHYHTEHVCYDPPREVWEGPFDCGYERCDEGYEPRKLLQGLVSHFCPS